MAFENLTEKLTGIFAKLKGKGKVSEKDIREAMRQIKLALLEADVSFKVVKDFISVVSEKANGAEVLESITPGQQIIKVVRDELVSLLGGADSKIAVAPRPPTVIMLVGLQGAGKTTTCAKLAIALKKNGKRPALVACDVYRPAAIKQLEVVGEQAQVTVFTDYDEKNPVNIAKKFVGGLDTTLYDTVIIDTAGRLHINEQLMDELEQIKATVKPTEILLVVDAMTGQDAVNVAEGFHSKLGIDGVILTKMDGDTRGGAALSIKSVTGKPIKYCSTGEKISELETFYPDRLASRILGMGDVLTLIDRAQQAFDEKTAAEFEKKVMQQRFDLNDFLSQLEQVKKMGALSDIIPMLPGVNSKALEGVDLDNNHLARTQAIIQSMTMQERSQPSIINSSRKKRIADGSGRPIQEVNQLLKQFEQMQKMMKLFTGKGMKKQMKKNMKKQPGGLGGKFRFPF